MIGRLYRLPAAEARRRAQGVLERFELVDAADRRVLTYSGGMRRRLDLGASLVGRPPIILLDEPTTGLDPAGMRDMKTLVRRLSAEGITVMLSSHQMTDVEELCNRVAIINRGRILYEGHVADLKRSLGTWYRLRVSDLAGARRVAEGFELADVRVEGDELRFSADEPVVEAFTVALGRAGVGVRSLVPQQATLEQVFFELTESDGAAPAAPEPALEAVG
jgi:ABC-2 type transport system ATP-binding protein